MADTPLALPQLPSEPEITTAPAAPCVMGECVFRAAWVHGAQFTSRRTFTAAGQLEIETYSGGLLDGLAVSNHYNALLQRDGLAVLGVAGAPAVADSSFSLRLTKPVIP